VQASERIFKVRCGMVRLIQRRHERKNAHEEKQVRRERAEKPESGRYSQTQINGGDGPGNEHGRFVEIIDRASVDGITAFVHGGRVQGKGDEEQVIIGAVVLAETFSPQENRIQRAQAVNDHSEQKEMTVGEPSHLNRLIQNGPRASGNSLRPANVRDKPAQTDIVSNLTTLSSSG
jgi:hypothetical protein